MYSTIDKSTTYFSTIFSKLDKATVVVNPSTVAAIKGIDTFLGILLKLKF